MDDEAGPILRVTRESLRDGSLIAFARRFGQPGMRILSDAELDASLDATLAQHDPARDVELLAYGSLMWNPVVRVSSQAPALVRGWHRRFCLHLTSGRGSVERPGLMLALDRGGACAAMSLRIPASIAREELALLWRREMFTGSYQARWVQGVVAGRRERLLAFVANRAHPRYLKHLDEAEMVRRLAHARGHLGSCREYLMETVQALRAHHLHDSTLERLARLVSHAQ